MAQYTISDITFLEEGDALFRIEFMVQDHALRTNPISRTANQQEVKDEVILAVTTWIANRADANFADLKNTYEGQTIQLKI